MLFTGLVNVPATAQTSSGPFSDSSTLNAASVNASVITPGVTSTITAKKYVVFRDDDVGFGNLSALEALDQVHVEENVPVTLAIIPHPNPCGTGNELLQETGVLNYLRSIVDNPLFEFAQHGYNHYDYKANGPPDCSASTAGAGVPQVVGAEASSYKVGESPGPGQLVPGQPVGTPSDSEFWGRPYADQYNAIKQGRDDMIQALGVAPTTFVPPWNSGDTNTLKACSALGFTLYSTSISDFNVRQAYLDGITVQGESGGLDGWNNNAAWQTGMQALTKGTDAALNNMTAGQSFVLGYHFWSFENPDGSVNPAWVALFKQYIDHLKSRGDVLFTTVGGQQLLNPSPAPAVCSDGNSLDAFAQGAYHALWYKYLNDTTSWSSWEYLGGYLTSSPAATSPVNGMIDVVARGPDGAVWWKYTTNGGASWSNWYSLGGQIPAGTAPTVSSWGAGRLDVFAKGTNGALWHKAYSGTSGWSSWQSLGGSPTSSPAATSRNTGGITVFARGTDGGIWYRDYVGSSWGPWTSIGGAVAAGTGPAACSWGGGRLDVFVQCTNGALYHKSYTGTSGWSGWQSLGGSPTSSPAATSPANGVLDVFARGSDDGLWEDTYNSGWSGWTSAGAMWS